jgi:predicted dehydrogenase
MGHNRARLMSQTEGAKLVTVIDIDEERARKVGTELNVPWALTLDEALRVHPEIECVMVMTPSGTHSDVGCQVAESGRHVITTKPMDVSVTACNRLIKTCERRGVHLMVDFQSRYVDDNVRLAHAVQQGWLGKPLLAEFRFKWWRPQEYYDERGGWRGTWKLDGGGSIANQGVHGLDLLLWVMGTPSAVYAESVVMSHEIETEDLSLVIFDFPNGAKGAMTTTTTFPEASPYYSFEVHGTEGGVLFDDALGGTGRYFVKTEVRERMAQIANPLKSVIDDAIRVIRNGAKPAIDGREGRRTVHMLETIYRSAREGRKIAVEPVAD